MNKKSKIIIILLLIIIVILFAFAILFATDVISLGTSNNNDIKQNIEKNTQHIQKEKLLP